MEFAVGALKPSGARVRAGLGTAIANGAGAVRMAGSLSGSSPETALKSSERVRAANERHERDALKRAGEDSRVPNEPETAGVGLIGF